MIEEKLTAHLSEYPGLDSSDIEEATGFIMQLIGPKEKPYDNDIVRMSLQEIKEHYERCEREEENLFGQMKGATQTPEK